FADALKHPFDLFVELVAVGDDRDARVRIVLQNPLGEQHHDDALAGTLGVPDDAALAASGKLLRSLDPELLMRPGQLLDPGVEQDEIAHQLDQPFLAAELRKILVELVAVVLLLVLLPLQEVFRLRADSPVLQPLGVIAGKNELDRGEEPFIELRPLIGKALAEALADADAAVLQLQDADGDAIHIQNEIGPALMPAPVVHFLGKYYTGI